MIDFLVWLWPSGLFALLAAYLRFLPDGYPEFHVKDPHGVFYGFRMNLPGVKITEKNWVAIRQQGCRWYAWAAVLYGTVCIGLFLAAPGALVAGRLTALALGGFGGLAYLTFVAVRQR